MYCHFCAQTSPEGSLFCKPCGSPFHLAPCPRCAAVNDLKVVSCYKCKAILPIRRAEIRAAPSNGGETERKNTESVTEGLTNQAARKAESADDSAAAHASSAGIKENGEEEGYQKTIPVLRPIEKVHDAEYLKTVALQRVAIEAPQLPPAELYDANYQKTIALQRRPVAAQNEAYIKTISLQHPPASLAGDLERDVAFSAFGEADSFGSAYSPSSRSQERAHLPIDLVQKAKWGQRALLASLALLLIVAAAYFFLREQKTAVSASSVDPAPAQLQTEALTKIPVAPVNKAIDPSPSKLSVDAAKQADKKVGVQTAPPIKPLPAKPAAAIAVTPAAVNRQTKSAPPGEVLYLPPGATAASAAATAAAIATAIGKKSPAPPASASAPIAEVKGTGNSGAVSLPPAPCIEALAALGLCVITPASPKP